jgi:hypothetical protein
VLTIECRKVKEVSYADSQDCLRAHLASGKPSRDKVSESVIRSGMQSPMWRAIVPGATTNREIADNHKLNGHICGNAITTYEAECFNP